MPAASRVALVTGSSRGLGRAIAHRLAADGLAVAVNDAHGGERAAAVAAAITEEGGVAAAFGADVTNEAQVRRMVEAIEAALARSMCWSSTPPAPSPRRR